MMVIPLSIPVFNGISVSIGTLQFAVYKMELGMVLFLYK